MPTKQPVEHINARHVDAALHAARESRSLCRFRNAFVPGAAGWQTIVGADVVYNIQPGERVLITGMCCGVHTFNDDCHFQIGWCDQPDGGGVFHALCSDFHIATGGAIAGAAEHDRKFAPCLIAKYVDGAQSITYQINPNDALCEIKLCWMGWHEVGD